MEYDFFDEKISETPQNEGQEPADNDGERVPAPLKTRKKLVKRVLCVVGGVAVVAAAFFGGMLTRWYTIEPEMRTLIKVKEKIDKEYYYDISDESFYDAIFSTVNARLLDPYSGYMTAEEYAAALQDMAGNRSGIGLVVSSRTATGEKQMLVTRVSGNSPAEAAGITSGSYIVGFGKSETEIEKSEDFSVFEKFLAERAEGENFCLQVKKDAQTRIYTICKRAYVENYVFYRSNANAYSFETTQNATPVEKGAPLACLGDDTAYIRLVQFAGNAAEEFDQAMGLFKTEGKKNLVLDLRGNGGGYLDILQKIAKYFCKNSDKDKPVAAIADYGEKKEYYLAADNVYGEYFAADSRICVLADSGTASASECLIGVMVDHGATAYADICLSERGGVAKTYGKGIMQTTYYVDMIKRDAIKLTTAEIRWPSEYCIHGRGVLPEDGTKTVAENYDGDGELKAALAALFA